MGTKRSLRFYTGIILLLLTLTVRQQALAASGSIIAEPSSGSFTAGSLLNIDVKIDGGGVPFNAAKADIALSPSATIQSIQFGDCGFAFIEPPTTLNPSFVGVILGGSSRSCTAYTMRFQAAVPGTQIVNISNASIKSYDGANEELRTVKNGSFSITQSSVPVTPIIGSPVEKPTVDTNGNRLYSVSYSVPVPGNSPSKNYKVVLDSGIAPSRVSISEADNSGLLTASFENVPEGAHTLSVASDGKPISEEVVYIQGDNKNLAFGASQPKNPQQYIWYIGAGVIAILIVGLGVIGFRYYKKKKNENEAAQVENQAPPLT